MDARKIHLPVPFCVVDAVDTASPRKVDSEATGVGETNPKVMLVE